MPSAVEPLGPPIPQEGSGIDLKLGRTRSKPSQEDISKLRKNLQIKEIQHDTITFDHGPSLGAGSFGEVRSGTWANVPVAVKTLRPATNDIKFLREVTMMTRVNHPRIVRFYGFCMSPKCIVMELLGSSLKDKLKKGQLPPPLCLKYALDVASGLCYLHALKPRIVHRDLKPENILVASDGLRIADFGISAEVEGTDFGTRCGSNWYMAPEVMLAQEYSEKADIFSFGIVLWEMLNGKEPYHEEQKKGLKLQIDIAQRKRRPIWSKKLVQSSLRELVEQCWQHSPLARPTMNIVLSELRDFYRKPNVRGDAKTVVYKAGIPPPPQLSAGTTQVGRSHNDSSKSSSARSKAHPSKKNSSNHKNELSQRRRKSNRSSPIPRPSSANSKRLRRVGSKREKTVVPETPWHFTGGNGIWSCESCGVQNGEFAVRCEQCQTLKRRDAAMKSAQKLARVMSEDTDDGGTQEFEERKGRLMETEFPIRYTGVPVDVEDQNQLALAVALSLSEQTGKGKYKSGTKKKSMRR